MTKPKPADLGHLPGRAALILAVLLVCACRAVSHQISTLNQSLRGVISHLSDAYLTFFASNGKNSNAKEALAVASRKFNSICPGTAS